MWMSKSAKSRSCAAFLDYMRCLGKGSLAETEVATMTAAIANLRMILLL